MPRTTKTVTFSLSPELARELDEVRAAEGRTASEVLRTALRRYLDDLAWRRIFAEGERRARALGIGPEDVERLVDEYRTEAGRRARRP